MQPCGGPTFLLIGTIFSGLLAYGLAHRMTEPIRLLEEGVKRRIGSGLFDHRITIKTGDEFQLADSFRSFELALAQRRVESVLRGSTVLAPQVADLVDRTGDDSVLEGRRLVVQLYSVTCAASPPFSRTWRQSKS